MTTLTLQRTAAFLEAIKFSHSVFALPFALVAMLVAAGGLPPWDVIAAIVLACVAARTAAMCFNRLVDLPFDARNPRTAKRALVTGELPARFMWGAIGVSSVVFFLCAAYLNRTCLLLSPPVLGILFAYSYAKRFTNFSHYILGIALGLAPVGAWLAVTGTFAWTPIILALAVLAWVAGFDILYSCQDAEIDSRERELHSLPKRFGIAGAMRLARRTHLAAALLFLLFWWVAEPLGFLSLLGVLGIGLLLRHQHSLLSPGDLSRIDAAFFTTNGLISLGFLGVVALDILLL
jgi:4-hydroxybenzoate polyprenyltransferase